MIGYVEEAPERAARRALMSAARRYASKWLLDMFCADAAEEELVRAALAYAEAVRPRRRKQ